jgi:hypothetical protein
VKTLNAVAYFDKHCVGGFTERALQIMEAAEAATACGETCTEMTIAILQDGGIQIFAESDWPLDSLAYHHGAKAVYRVSERRGSVRVEGREGLRTCVMESRSPMETARRMLR